MKLRKIEKWIAPLHDVAAFSADGVELKKERMETGYYHGGGYGYYAYEVLGRWQQNVLLIDGAVWMSDAPHDAITIGQDMELVEGESVLLGGLGFGLHLRELIRVAYSGKVVVVERDKRIIDAILPTIEDLNKLDFTCVHDDFWKHCVDSEMNYACIHWDCFAGCSEYNIAVDAAEKLMFLKMLYGSDAHLIFHGAPSLNIVTNNQIVIL